MKKMWLAVTVAAALMMTACGDSEERLRERAAELCNYLPGQELSEKSRDYLTEDFYAVLDTLFNLPEHEAMDHEWLHYFVTANGSTMAGCEVVNVEKSDATHAVATLSVRQQGEDCSPAATSTPEEHRLLMEKVGGEWLMADFDGHKEDCIRHIAINREEQALRQAISDHLVSRIGSLYLKGELCVPVLTMVAEEGERVWGDFWIYWYNVAGDTLKTVAGGNHAGLMTLAKEDGSYKVTAFEQVADGSGNQASAKRIFGSHYDVYWGMHSNQQVREAVRQEQLRDYVRRHGLPVRYYQDYGWPAVEL